MRRLLLLLLSVLAVPVWAETFLVAAGAVPVTPPVGTYLAGYGRDRVSSGSHDELWARAVVVRTGDAALTIVTVDNIGLPRPDIQRMRAAVARTLPGMALVVSSTHTHAGPDVVGLWGPNLWSSGRDEAYMTGLVDAVAELVKNTAGALVPAHSRVGRAQVPMAWVENVSEPELLDRQLSVLQFVDAAGTSLATLTNYACHPTVLGPDNTLVSADYVDGFYTGMAAGLPGQHLFLQGAIGGWVQPMQGDRSIELARTIGTSLAEAALQVLAEEAVDNPYQALRFQEQELDVPLANWGFRTMMWLGVLDRPTFEGAMRTSVAWFSVGRAEFVTHPGETSPAYSLASRRLMQSPYGFVMGLTQDAMGYILKPEYFEDDAAYPHADYLRSVSVGPEAGPLIMQTLEEIVP